MALIIKVFFISHKLIFLQIAKDNNNFKILKKGRGRQGQEKGKVNHANVINFQFLGHLPPLGPKTETLLDRDFESPAGICLIIILVENDVSLLARSI